MTTRFHTAAKELHGALKNYAKYFDFLEFFPRIAPGSTCEQPKLMPSLPTLHRWRKEVPPSFDFCVVGGKALSSLQPGPEFEHEKAVALQAIQVLQARCFLLRTPPQVTPAAVWRTRMATLLAQLPRDATQVVWQPSGVWDSEQAAAAAQSWGVLLAVDPLRDPVPSGPVAYIRLRALGETRSFGPSLLERVVRAVGERREVYVVLETQRAKQESRSLREIAQHGERGVPELGRLIRPSRLLSSHGDE